MDVTRLVRTAAARLRGCRYVSPYPLEYSVPVRLGGHGVHEGLAVPVLVVVVLDELVDAAEPQICQPVTRPDERIDYAVSLPRHQMAS